MPLLKRFLLIVGTAALVVGVLLGGGWLSTHQSSLQGLGPLALVLGLGAMVYGARSSRKKPK